jgi:hypothetical protein
LEAVLDDPTTQSPQISIEDLQERWQQFHALKEGEGIEALSIYEMPPWETICEQLDWHHHLLSGGYFDAKRHGFCGVYRLIALENAGDVYRPAKLSRLCGVDASGTLYVGKASDLSIRLNQLRRSARNYRSEGSHGAISMLRRIKRLDYPEEKLAVALLFTGRLTGAVESDLLYAYINSFGDMPPLNYRL